MAKNAPKGPGRRGAVRERSQFKNPANGLWFKRDRNTGKIMAAKKDGTRFKGVTRER